MGRDDRAQRQQPGGEGRLLRGGGGQRRRVRGYSRLTHRRGGEGMPRLIMAVVVAAVDAVLVGGPALASQSPMFSGEPSTETGGQVHAPRNTAKDKAAEA